MNAVPPSMDRYSKHEGLGRTHPGKQLIFLNAVSEKIADETGIWIPEVGKDSLGAKVLLSCFAIYST